MPSLRREWLGVAALGLLGSPVAHATDTVSAEVDGTHFPSSGGGGTAYGGQLSFQHSYDHGGWVIGAGDTQFPVGALGVGNLDVYRIVSPHLAVSAGASIGDATTPNTSNTLYKARVSVDSRIDATWSVHLGDQYIDLAAINGHLMNVGAEYRPAPRWGMSLAGGYSVSGTMADRYGQLSVNWYGTDPLFGGIVMGRTGYDPANLGQIAVVRRLLQVYFGASVPMRLGTLTFGADTLNLEGASRETLRVGFSRPLK